MKSIDPLPGSACCMREREVTFGASGTAKASGFSRFNRLHAQIGIHPLQPTVLIRRENSAPDCFLICLIPWPSSGRPATHPCRHTSPATCRTTHSLLAIATQSPAGQRDHAMLTAKLGHRHSALGMPQDHKDMGFAVSTCLHLKSPRSSGRENSTSAAPYFRGR